MEEEVKRRDSKGEQVGTSALFRIVHTLYPKTGTFGIYNPRLTRDGDKVSIHTEGRAWDCKCSARKQKATGDKIFNLLIEKSEPLGIEKIIWDRKVWSAGKTEDYTGVNPHTDHLHIEQSMEKATTLTYASTLTIFNAK